MITEPGYGYPNSVVTRTFQGDSDYAAKFRGEEDILLFQLKNLMTFRHLTQLRMERHFTDGTIITAWSIVNQGTKVATDFINTDVRNAVVGERSRCAITFIDFPESVPPMRNPHEIVAGEVEGVDYFKTYYLLDITGCGNCSEIQWEFILNYHTPSFADDGSVLIPYEPRHWVNPVTGAEDVDDHTVYSLSYPGWGEIITHDHDENGQYIIWKAYTETGDYTRTGLAVPLLRASVLTPDGITICKQEVKFDVDCCLKGIADRPVVMHWQADTPLLCDGGYEEEGWCHVPAENKKNDLFWFQSFSWVYVDLWIKNNACIPMDWSVTGASLMVSNSTFVGDLNQKSITWVFPMYALTGLTCEEDFSLLVHDRCGTEASAHFKSCCASLDDPTVSIAYTTLIMGPDQQQTLTAWGGCAPYEWSLSGVGSLEVSADTLTAVYTSPSSNENCVNATISLTDCCKHSGQVRLAINISGMTGTAFCVCNVTISNVQCIPTGGPCGLDWCCVWDITWSQQEYDCSGSLIVDKSVLVEDATTNCAPNCADPCNTGPPYQPGCDASELRLQSQWDGWVFGGYYCSGGQPRCTGDLIDVRSALQKEQGCCPINPLTGLPYD